MKKNFTHLLTGVAIATLSACGGGGGAGGSNSPASSSTLSGSVMDGYLTGATVCLDTNANLLCDSGEPTATSQAKGAWSFSVPAGTDTSKLHIIAVINANTIDADTGTAPQQGYTLLAPATAASVVTPLTTLVSHTLLESPGLTLAQAQAKAISDSNLPAGTKFDEDYVAKSNTSAHNVAKLIADVLGQSTTTVNTSAAPSNDSEKGMALKVALAQAKSQIAAYAQQAASAANQDALRALRNSAKAETQAAITSDTSISTSVKSTAKVGTPKPVNLSSAISSDGMFAVWPDSDCSVGLAQCIAGATYKRTYATDSTHIVTEGFFARKGSNTWGAIPKDITTRYMANRLTNSWVDQSSVPENGTIELSSNGMSGLFTNTATKSTINLSIAELDVSGKNSKDVAKLNYNYCSATSTVTSIGCIELLDFDFPTGSKLFVTTFYDNEDDYIYWDCGNLCGVFAAGNNTPVPTLDAAIASINPLFHFGGAYIELDANGQKVSLFDESEQPPTPLASGTYQIQTIAGLRVFSLNVTTVHDPAKWFNKGRDKYTLSTIWVENNGKVWVGKKDNKGTTTQTTYFNRTAVDTIMRKLGLPATKP